MSPSTFINIENGETLLCYDTTHTTVKNGTEFINVTRKKDNISFEIEKNKLNVIQPIIAEKLISSNYKIQFPDQVNCIINYDIVDTGWAIKKWFRYDQTKLVHWYNNFIKEYEDWKWSYGLHKDQWMYDPQEKIGNFMKHDTSWIMLTWGDDRKGPVPWLRYIAKPEYVSQMPKNLNSCGADELDNNLGARECFKGYAREIIDSMPCGPHDIQVAIHTPGTQLPSHQDLPDNFRFHIPIETHSDATFTIEGKEIHIPADGWVYLVNTSKLHSTNNKSNIDRVHIYGSVWAHQILELDLEKLETIL
jgi:hypothetical protein